MQALVSLINGIPQPILVSNRQTSRILLANNAAIKHFGVEKHTLIGESALSLGLWHSPAVRAQLLALLDAEGAVIDHPIGLHDSLGRPRPGIISITPVLLDGTPALLTAFRELDAPSDDIEAMRSAEIRLRCQLQAQKMEAIGHLASALAHDFNNILAAMMLRLELLGIEAEPSEAVCSAVEELGAETKRAAHLTRQLLLFSRRESAICQPTDFNELLVSSLDTLSKLVCPKVHIDLQPADGPVWINGDACMIEQVLLHLVANARDAMPDGGTITLRLALLPVPSSHPCLPPSAPHGPHACLMIADNGCGIQETVQHHLFEPFFTTKPAGKGSGMGLATAYGIVQQHRGWIEVDTKPERGTVFSVFIPALATPPGPAQAATTPFPAKATTILFVEDNPSIRRIATLVLQQRGHRVLEASTGREGLFLWHQHADEIGLIIVDLILPDGLIGLDIIAEATRSHPDIPTILMSGFDTQAERELKLPPSCGFLHKPFDAATLLREVQTALVAPGKA